MQTHFRVAKRDGLAIAGSLRRSGKILAVAQPHEVERLLRRQHRAVAGTRVVGMAVGDHGLVHRTGRIDKKTAAFAAHAGRCRHQNVFGAHGR